MVSTPTIYDQIRPSVQMVADLVRTRVITEGGGEMPPTDLDFNSADSFTTLTYPSAAQVERLIDQSTVAIVAQVPGSIVEDYLPAARHLAALYAAILVEGSYFREQLTDDQIELYRNLLTSGIRGLGNVAGAAQSGVLAGGPVQSVLQRSVMTDSPFFLWELDIRDWTVGLPASTTTTSAMPIISLVPDTTDLELYAGDGVSLLVSATDQAGNPLDLTQAADVQAQIRRSRNDASPLTEFQADPDPGLGALRLSLTGTQTASLVVNGPFEGAWDLQWTPTGLEPTTLVQGKVSCGLDVSRP